MNRFSDPETLEALRNSSFAAYDLHQFCIRLPPEVSLLDEDGRPRSDLERGRFAILVHEYYHYLHNLSTVAGWTNFELYQRAIAIFSSTLDEHGHCDPNRLTPEAQLTLSETAEGMRVMQGGSRFEETPSRVVDASPRSLDIQNVSIGGVAVQDAIVTWDVHHRDSSVTNEAIHVGSLIIEEGINYLLEEFVRQDDVTFDESFPKEVPFYPYRAYRKLCLWLAPSISPVAAVRLGILALSLNRPGVALVKGLKAYQRLRDEGFADDGAYCRVSELVQPTIKDILRRIREKNSEELKLDLVGRGLLEEGMGFVVSSFQGLLNRREADPWFDVQWCSTEGRPDASQLQKLLKEVVPCDIIQRGTQPEDTVGRDHLLSFMNGQITRDLAGPHSGVRALHAQFKFFLAHYRENSFVVPAGRGCKCPYYTSCTLQIRRDEPEVCAFRPWERSKLTETCWYGAGVLGTIGLVTLKLPMHPVPSSR